MMKLNSYSYIHKKALVLALPWLLLLFVLGVLLNNSWSSYSVMKANSELLSESQDLLDLKLKIASEFAQTYIAQTSGDEQYVLLLEATRNDVGSLLAKIERSERLASMIDMEMLQNVLKKYRQNPDRQANYSGVSLNSNERISEMLVASLQKAILAENAMSGADEFFEIETLLDISRAAGDEAVLALALSRATNDPLMLSQYAASVSTQDILTNRILLTRLSEKARAELAAMQSTETSIDIQALRDVLVYDNDTQPVHNAAAVFDIYSSRLEQLARFSRFVLSEQIGRDAQTVSESWRSLKIKTLLIAMLLIVAIWTAISHLRRFGASINEALSALTTKEASTLVVDENDEAQDELGRLSVGIQDVIRELNDTKRAHDRLVRSVSEYQDLESSVNKLSDYVDMSLNEGIHDAINVSGGPAIERLSKNIAALSSNMGFVTEQIEEATNMFSANLNEAKEMVKEQHAGVSEQAASINETTAALGEIKATSKQTLQKASMLAEASERIRSESEDGREAVEHSVDAMKMIQDRVDTIASTILALSAKTQQIGEITSLVSRLAQQSKMLALNASIEAAKAGSAGKGFAVVASEVRDLAEQSQSSTAQVHKLLEDIRHATDKAVMATEEGSKGVDEGMTLIEQSGAVIDNLNFVIRETNVASQQIVAAVRQEAAGIDQVTTAMTEINLVTSSFVHSSKRSSEIVNELQSLATDLKRQISKVV